MEPLKFSVQYSYNCDGGVQEFSTAKTAILAVFPDAEVKGERNHNYPIKVTIRNGEGKIVWNNDQRALFRKYAMVRAKSIEEIKDVMRKTKRAMRNAQRATASTRR